MPKTRQARLARRRIVYTNESFEQGYQALADLPDGAAPLPEADCRDQENLESDIFPLLLRGGSYQEFPFGIRRTQPGTRTVRLEVESEQRAEEIIAALLPAHEPDGELGGIPGLRIHARSHRGIELHQPERQCSVWLTGLPSPAWHSIETRHLWHIT